MSNNIVVSRQQQQQQQQQDAIVVAAAADDNSEAQGKEKKMHFCIHFDLRLHLFLGEFPKKGF